MARVFITNLRASRERRYFNKRQLTKINRQQNYTFKKKKNTIIHKKAYG
jgi:hypothetical protein